MRFLFYILLLTFLFTAISCGSYKKQGAQWKDSTLQKKKGAAREELVFRFDADTPDTKFNWQRFIEFFHFEPGADIKNIYCSADNPDIDSKYQFSFQCNLGTVYRIAKTLELRETSTTEDYTTMVWQNFPWWDSTKIVTLQPHWKKNEEALNQYLWYDRENSKAYFFDSDK